MIHHLPIWIEEPAARKKITSLAGNLFKIRLHKDLIAEVPGIRDIKLRLKKIRQDNREHMSRLAEEFVLNVIKKYPGVKVQSAADAKEAIEYIAQYSDGMSTISINNWSVANQELKPGLVDKGFDVVNSYLDEFDVQEGGISEYWKIPCLLQKGLIGAQIPLCNR